MQKSVKIMGFIPEEAVVERDGASDICAAPYYNAMAVSDSELDKMARGARMARSPLKLYGYLACGRLMVASHFWRSRLRLWIENTSCPNLITLFFG